MSGQLASTFEITSFEREILALFGAGSVFSVCYQQLSQSSSDHQNQAVENLLLAFDQAMPGQHLGLVAELTETALLCDDQSLSDNSSWMCALKDILEGQPHEETRCIMERFLGILRTQAERICDLMFPWLDQFQVAFNACIGLTDLNVQSGILERFILSLVFRYLKSRECLYPAYSSQKLIYHFGCDVMQSLGYLEGFHGIERTQHQINLEWLQLKEGLFQSQWTLQIIREKIAVCRSQGSLDHEKLAELKKSKARWQSNLDGLYINQHHSLIGSDKILTRFQENRFVNLINLQASLVNLDSFLFYQAEAGESIAESVRILLASYLKSPCLDCDNFLSMVMDLKIFLVWAAQSDLKKGLELARQAVIRLLNAGLSLEDLWKLVNSQASQRNPFWCNQLLLELFDSQIFCFLDGADPDYRFQVLYQAALIAVPDFFREAQRQRLFELLKLMIEQPSRNLEQDVQDYTGLKGEDSPFAQLCLNEQSRGVRTLSFGHDDIVLKGKRSFALKPVSQHFSKRYDEPLCQSIKEELKKPSHSGNPFILNYFVANCIQKSWYRDPLKRVVIFTFIAIVVVALAYFLWPLIAAIGVFAALPVVAKIVAAGAFIVAPLVIQALSSVYQFFKHWLSPVANEAAKKITHVKGLGAAQPLKEVLKVYVPAQKERGRVAQIFFSNQSSFAARELPDIQEATL